MGPSFITKQKNENKIVIKMSLLSLYLLDIVNTSIASHASKMLNLVGICVCNMLCMPTFGVWDLDLGSESKKLVLLYRFGFNLIRMYCLLGRLVLRSEQWYCIDHGVL